MSLKGKTLFITGASRGIGLAIALKAARDGANIAIAAKTTEPNPKLPGTIFTAAAEIEKAGGKALPMRLRYPLRGSGGRGGGGDRREQFGGMDICVNNASAISLTGTQETDMKRFDLMNQINARGTFLVSKLCLPHLLQAANPHVLMLSPPLDMQPKWFAGHTGLFHGQVRDEPLRAGHGGGVRGPDRLQCAVAAHRHRHGRHPAGRRQRRGRPQMPHAGDPGRCGLSRSSTSRWNFSGNFLIDDTFLAEDGRHRLRPLSRRSYPGPFRGFFRARLHAAAEGVSLKALG